MTISVLKRIPYPTDGCCICGALNCQQATDHEKLSFNDLNNIVMDCKMSLPQIDSLKAEVGNHFLNLKRNLLSIIKQKQETVQKWLNSFYFKNVQDHVQKNITIFYDILQNDLSKLPNKQISKTVKLIKKKNGNKSTQKPNIRTIEEDIERFLKKMDINKMTQQISKEIAIEEIVKKKINSQLSKSGKSTKSNSTTSTQSQKKIELSPALETYEWKYVRFTRNTKTIDLSNRNITDEDMIKQMPIISTFTNIKEFQVRNNKITALTCNIIANDMKFLSVLDMRGNKVGDAGVSKIVTSMNNLKSLFVSQTGITNKTGQLIAIYLPELQTLWSEHTNMTGQVCVKICQKPKLRLLSLIGNPIQQEHKANIRSIFMSKGYLNI